MPSIRNTFLILIFLSLLPLLIAYGAEFKGLTPCPLCYYQRIPFFVTLFAALFGYFVLHVTKYAKYLVYFIGILFLTNAGLGFYHMGVENHWFSSISDKCAINSPLSYKKNITKQDILEDIENQSRPSCSKAPFSFLGFSMAGWNMLYNVGLTFLVSYRSYFFTRKKHGNIF